MMNNNDLTGQQLSDDDLEIPAISLIVTGGGAPPLVAEGATLIQARLPPQPTEEQLREYLDRKRREAGGR